MAALRGPWPPRGLFRVLLLLLAVVALSATVASTAAIRRETAQEHESPTVQQPHPDVIPIPDADPKGEGNAGFLHAFMAALSVIVVSELGDRTFFIAAIMAMSYNRLTVLSGAMLALGLMTCLSVLLGYATIIVPRIYTYYVSTALFFVFGVRMLREGLRMSGDEGQEELAEVQAEIKKKEWELQGDGAADGDAGDAPPQGPWLGFISPVFLQAFTLTFLAEWGDRSQLTTIMLAATEHPVGVAAGGSLGHGLCTGLAVVGGRMVAKRISARTVTITGGIVFLIFAMSSVFIKLDFDFRGP